MKLLKKVIILILLGNVRKNLRFRCQMFYLHIGVSIFLVKYKDCDNAFCKLLLF